MSQRRAETRVERRTDALVHLVGLVAGVAGCAVLAMIAATGSDVRTMIALAVYGLGLMAMLVCSAVYNLARAGQGGDPWLRRADHAAIFVMIAGTYTPFALVTLPRDWGMALLGFVWTVATLGVLAKLFLAARFERWSLAAYLLLGWTVLAAVEPVLESLYLAGLVLLGVGGLLYTLGTAFYRWETLPFHNTVWHLFVLAAAACHFAAVVQDVALA